MKSVSRSTGRKLPPPVRTETVFMGRNDFLSTIIRLIGVELYKIRRRGMSKVLTTISILSIVLIFGLISLGTLFTASSPASTYLPPSCTTVRDPQLQPCLNHDPTQADMAQAEQQKQEQLHGVSSPLRLPDSLGTGMQIIRFIGTILVFILVGTIVGGEFGIGTVRLMFTRGPTRTQFLLSKIGASLSCIVLGVLGLLLIGVLEGALLNLIFGIAFNFSFLTATWLLHAVLYILIGMLGLFIYAIVALFLSTLGQTTVAGVAGGLAVWVAEFILSQLLNVFGLLYKSPVGDFLKAIPDYFIGNNVAALLQNQAHDIFGDTSASLSDLHALLVLATYIVLLLGLGWWINERRDITN